LPDPPIGNPKECRLREDATLIQINGAPWLYEIKRPTTFRTSLAYSPQIDPSPSRMLRSAGRR